MEDAESAGSGYGRGAASRKRVDKFSERREGEGDQPVGMHHHGISHVQHMGVGLRRIHSS